jgi:hypothetical protein
MLACVMAMFSRERSKALWPRVIVVNDGIGAEHFDCWPNTVVEGVKPFVFSRNINLGIRAAGTDDVILLNDDATLQTRDGFKALAECAQQHPDYGVISPAVDLIGNPNQWPGGLNASLRECGWSSQQLRDEPRRLCFVCVYIPRTTIEKVGLLDESFTTYGGEDDDYCYRVTLAGLKLGVFDGCFVKHSELHSTFRGDPHNGSDYTASREHFKEKWGFYAI